MQSDGGTIAVLIQVDSDTKGETAICRTGSIV
jgi:hypothetical protein